MHPSRRQFLQAAAAAAAAMPVAAQPLSAASPAAPVLDVLRAPDAVRARLADGSLVPLVRSASQWSGAGIALRAEPQVLDGSPSLPVHVAGPGGQATHLHLRWQGRSVPQAQLLGDAWERGYGDLAWRTTVPERVMPWYFLLRDPSSGPLSDGHAVTGYGVMVQPCVFCFWQHDAEGISLWLDLCNGGDPALLGDRELAACTVRMRHGQPGERVVAAAHAFCSMLSPAPRLPAHPIFGSNDWNYAYGHNTAAGILRDTDLVTSLAPPGPARPWIVIDDGWQDPKRFPDMAALAAQIAARGAGPGLWIRPLRAPATAAPALLLPAARFGKGDAAPAYDPTVPEALEAVLASIRTPVQWGYRFIKHDFSTWEFTGQWGFQMGATPTRPGWRLQDRTRTNAEVLLAFYRALRQAAGPQTVILGCNTVGHLAAGIFESQRIGDDTSGRDWERTRRYGVNALAHRIAQHRTFAWVDPDIVAITPDIAGEHTAQWMDVVARSGGSLFFAPDPRAVTPESRRAMREAMRIAASGAAGAPLGPELSTTPQQWQFMQPENVQKHYAWSAPQGAPPFAAD